MKRRLLVFILAGALSINTVMPVIAEPLKTETEASKEASNAEEKAEATEGETKASDKTEATEGETKASDKTEATEGETKDETKSEDKTEATKDETKAEEKTEVTEDETKAEDKTEVTEDETKVSDKTEVTEDETKTEEKTEEKSEVTEGETKLEDKTEAADSEIKADGDTKVIEGESKVEAESENEIAGDSDNKVVYVESASVDVEERIILKVKFDYSHFAENVGMLRICINDEEYTTIDPKEPYIYCYVNPKEIRDSISFKIYDGNNNLVELRKKSDDIRYEDDTFIYSVKNYIDSVFDTQSVADYYRSAANGLDLYGQYAQIYFNYNTDQVGYPASLDDVSASELVDAGQVKDIQVKGDSNIEYSGSSLMLNDVIELRHYFKFEDGSYCEENYKFLVSEIDKEGKKIAGTEEEYWLSQNGSLYYIGFGRFTPSDLDKKFLVEVKENGKLVYEIRYGVLSYIYDALTGTKASSELKNLCQALYIYYKSVSTGKERTYIGPVTELETIMPLEESKVTSTIHKIMTNENLMSMFDEGVSGVSKNDFVEWYSLQLYGIENVNVSSCNKYTYTQVVNGETTSIDYLLYNTDGTASGVFIYQGDYTEDDYKKVTRSGKGRWIRPIIELDENGNIGKNPQIQEYYGDWANDLPESVFSAENNPSDYYAILTVHFQDDWTCRVKDEYRFFCFDITEGVINRFSQIRHSRNDLDYDWGPQWDSCSADFYYGRVRKGITDDYTDDGKGIICYSTNHIEHAGIDGQMILPTDKLYKVDGVKNITERGNNKGVFYISYTSGNVQESVSTDRKNIEILTLAYNIITSALEANSGENLDMGLVADSVSGSVDYEKWNAFMKEMDELEQMEKVAVTKQGMSIQAQLRTNDPYLSKLPKLEGNNNYYISVFTGYEISDNSRYSSNADKQYYIYLGPIRLGHTYTSAGKETVEDYKNGEALWMHARSYSKYNEQTGHKDYAGTYEITRCNWEILGDMSTQFTKDLPNGSFETVTGIDISTGDYTKRTRKKYYGQVVEGMYDGLINWDVNQTIEYANGDGTTTKKSDNTHTYSAYFKYGELQASVVDAEGYAYIDSVDGGTSQDRIIASKAYMINGVRYNREYTNGQITTGSHTTDGASNSTVLDQTGSVKYTDVKGSADAKKYTDSLIDLALELENADIQDSDTVTKWNRLKATAKAAGITYHKDGSGALIAKVSDDKYVGIYGSCDKVYHDKWDTEDVESKSFYIYYGEMNDSYVRSGNGRWITATEYITEDEATTGTFLNVYDGIWEADMPNGNFSQTNTILISKNAYNAKVVRSYTGKVSNGTFTGRVNWKVDTTINNGQETVNDVHSYTANFSRGFVQGYTADRNGYVYIEGLNGAQSEDKLKALKQYGYAGLGYLKTVSGGCIFYN